MKATAHQLQTIFEQFQSARVWVIGDIMLDRYIWGAVHRISPEAPVPVVDVSSEETRLGGAANVALNLHALGAQVELFGVIGKDIAGRDLQKLISSAGISETGLVESSSRPTTSKTRILARNQQMLRIDHEQRQPLQAEEEKALINHFNKHLDQQPDLIILQDYNKGLLTEGLIDHIKVMAKENNIPFAVDPKKQQFWSFEGATLFKPNLKELAEGLNIPSEFVTDSDLEKALTELRNKMPHTYTLLTLSNKGIWLSDGNTILKVPAQVRNIADVSGAGDTVLSVAALGLIQGLNLNLLAELANIAGGMVCEEVGVVSIGRNRFLSETMRLLT